MLIYIAEQLEQRNIPLMKYSAANALQQIGPIFNKFLLCGAAVGPSRGEQPLEQRITRVFTAVMDMT